MLSYSLIINLIFEVLNMKKDKKQLQNKRKYADAALQKIEDARLEFYGKYKFHNNLKLVVTVICFMAILLVIFLKEVIANGTFQGLPLIIAILALAVAYGYSVYVKRKFNNKMKTYFELYFKSINDYALSSKGFKDVELQKPGKITLDEFKECQLYKDVCEAGSRGLTTFKYNKVEMSVVDCAGNIKDAKRMRPVFVGKMVRAKASYKGEKPVIIYLKGNDRALPPTNLEGIKKQEEDKKMIVYSNNEDYKKVLTAKARKTLEEIKTEKVLVDVAVSIYKGKAFAMLGYDDPLMVLPLQNEFDDAPTIKYKKDIEVVAKLLEALNK